MKKLDWLDFHLYDMTMLAGGKERYSCRVRNFPLLEAVRFDREFTRHVQAMWRSNSERAEAFRRTVSQK